MASPRKRKVKVAIGRTLAKGSTMDLEDVDDVDNLINIGLWGHDSSAAFTQGGTLVNPNGMSVPHNDGLGTLAAMDALMNASNWSTTAKHHYFSDDTTLIGTTEDNPATATEGVLYSPEGPGAKMIPKLEDVSAGTAVKFWIKPGGDDWTSTKNFRFGVQMAVGDASDLIKVYHADNDVNHDTFTPNGSGVLAAEIKGTYSHSTSNDGKGFYFTFDRDSAVATSQGGWHIFWETTDD